MDKASPSMDLRNLPIGELVKNKPNCFVLSDRSPIRFVMQEMAMRNILSVPLQNNQGKYVGIVNVGDISCFVAGFILGKNYDQPDEKIDAAALEKLDWDISSCLGLSEESKALWEYAPDVPLYKILEAFHKGVHRVLVSPTSHAGVKILTQTDVLRFLNENLEKFGKIAKMPVLPPLGEGERLPIHSFSDEKQAFHAFSYMMIKGVRAVPITNKDGKIIASLFQSDLRGLEPTDVKKLLLPIKDFMKELKRPADLPFSCKPDITTQEAIQIFLKSRILALWTVDQNQKPTRSISASDIIYKFAPY